MFTRFRSAKGRDVGPELRAFNALTDGGRTYAGRRITKRTARNFVAVYQCQTLIADGIATLPIDLFRKRPDGTREEVPASQSPAWIRQPNPAQTPVEFWTRVVLSLLSDGNAFIAVVRNEAGAVVALYCLAPEDVTVHPGPLGNNSFEVEGRMLSAASILHIPGHAIGNGVRGISPIEVAREAIGLGLAAEEFGARFFSQGTTVSGVIEHPGMPSQDEARLLRDMFRKTHGGMRNSHAVGVLTGGAAFKPISITPEHAQFLETRKFQKTEIAGLYRVPAYLVDPSVTSTWGSGIEEQNKWLADMTLLPWAVRIEQAVSTFLLPGSQVMKFNFDARLRPKTKDRYDAYNIAINAGIMSPDEVRALEDMDPLPHGDGVGFWRPANTVPVASFRRDAA